MAGPLRIHERHTSDIGGNRLEHLQPFPDQGKVDECEASNDATGLPRSPVGPDLLTTLNTTGMVSVACFSAAMTGVPCRKTAHGQEFTYKSAG
jgi:hypothetical protein